MKKRAHLFARDIVEQVLTLGGSGSKKLTRTAYFELIAALMMQRIYEEQWKKPTMIGLYLTEKGGAGLADVDSPPNEALLAAITEGVEENSPIDFLLCTYEEHDGSKQEFQLKRFGLQGNGDSDSLIAFINSLANKYAWVDAACLVAVADISVIDWEKVNTAIDKESVPFSELLLIGVYNDNFVVIGLKPSEGFSIYDLPAVVL